MPTDLFKANPCTGHNSAPLSSYLRIPLAWYNSSTHAFFSDETHNTIRRTYTSVSDPTSQRHFCGFCGTPVSYWSERPDGEGEYISLALGSLRGADLRDLEDLGLLPEGEDEDEEREGEGDMGGDGAMEVVRSSERGLSSEGSAGVPWFETMVEGSRLERMKRRRGGGQSKDGRVRVEWEVTEWTGNERAGEGEQSEGTTKTVIGTGKRKLEEAEGGE